MAVFKELKIWEQWSPPSQLRNEKGESNEALNDTQKQTLVAIEQRIQKSVSIYLSVWFFCSLTAVSSPDVLLLLSSSKIELPLVGYKLDFISFAIFSPFILEALLCKIFLLMEQKDKIRPKPKFSHNILAVENIITDFLSVSIAYASLPIYVMFLTWKAGVNEKIATYCIIILLFFLAQNFVMHLRRTAFERRALAVFFYLIIILMITMISLSIFHFRKLDLGFANLSKSNLSGANLSDSNLDHTDFGEANLVYVRLGNARINKANFTKSDLTNAFFSDPRDNRVRTVIKDTSFRNAVLVDANFFNTRIISSDFSGSNLAGANFHNATLTDVNFSGVDLSRIRLLKINQLESVCGNNETKMPPGFPKLPDCSGAPQNIAPQ